MCHIDFGMVSPTSNSYTITIKLIIPTTYEIHWMSYNRALSLVAVNIRLTIRAFRFIPFAAENEVHWLG